MIVIGGGVIGLELGSVWSRLGAEVTVVEYMPDIGAGMDAEMAKQFQKILIKQGMKFKMGTKVVSGSQKNGVQEVHVEPAKGGAKEIVWLAMMCGRYVPFCYSLVLTYPLHS